MGIVPEGFYFLEQSRHFLVVGLEQSDGVQDYLFLVFVLLALLVLAYAFLRAVRAFTLAFAFDRVLFAL